ncbi:MAG: phosphoheptose isomerase [Phycisphaerae bacterium]|nr:phosphoheptose isomerase [Phycisphaerae bacterium]MDG1898939.1 SIS domain-containing protein [Phycisphaerales bacterium]
MTSIQDHLSKRIDGSIKAIDSIREFLPELIRVGNSIFERMESGGILYTAGNGGSAANALHLAEELVGKYRSERPPMPAVCLNSDPTGLTCIANDFGFEAVFARPCSALLRRGDILLICSTSGRSGNLIEALQVARDNEILTVGLLGKDGGPCRDLCDHPIVIPNDDSAFIQDAHQALIHLLCEMAEQR